MAGQAIPISFFPNAYDGASVINKDVTLPPAPNRLRGDFDEAYDAPDYLNFFLSGRVRVPDGSGGFTNRIIPSFHRPALINYLVNVRDWADTGTLSPNDVHSVVDGIRRATFRPLPFDLRMSPPPTAGNPPLPAYRSQPFNSDFTGGSADYGLSTPITIPRSDFGSDPVPTIARLDLLADALTKGSTYVPTDPRSGNPWDVDNDGDGIPDSVWVDIGLPLISSPEGKLLRPLVAPQIEDTGGKFNLNAHGTYTQTQPEYRTQPAEDWAGTNTTAQRQVYRGLGYGPAEIALPSSGGTAASVSADGQAVISGELLNLLNRRQDWGRRAPAQVASAAGRDDRDVLDDLRTGTRPETHTLTVGRGFSSDPFGRGGVAVGRSGQLLAAVSGTEVEPQNAAQNQALINESVNDPYERDPSGRLDGDNLYRLDELEAILRNNSWDSDLLPARLRNLLGNSLGNNPELARMLATASVSFDHPSAVPPEGTRNNSYDGPVQLAQVLLARLRLDTGPRTGGESEAAYRQRIADENQKLYRLIAAELLRGRKLDINRPLGNGIDDNGNGVVDDPAEFGDGVDNPVGGSTNDLVDEVQELVDPGNPPNLDPARFTNSEAYPRAAAGAYGPQLQSQYGGRVPDYNFGLRDNDLSGSGRELLARHLYVLMMALTAELNPGNPSGQERYEIPISNHPDPALEPDRQEYTAHRIAQWAVNVVDYRDPDSSMTRFVYDPLPLDGWDLAIDANGDGTPDIGVGRFDQSVAGADPLPMEPSPVAWGIESPELLLNESLALHDVRVRDTDRDNGIGTDKQDQNNPDPNSDQVRVPQGSLFLELYCPRGQTAAPGQPSPPDQQSADPGVPQELYAVNAATGEISLDLTRTAPGGAPVWRVAISEPHTDLLPGSAGSALSPQLQREGLPDTYSFELDRPNSLEPPDPANQLRFERYIWFRNYQNVTQIQNVINNNGIRGNGTNPMDANSVFFAPSQNTRTGNAINADRLLSPGQYLTLAPRTLTHLGSKEDPPGTYPGLPSEQRFQVLFNQGLIQFDQTDRRVTPTLGPSAHHTAALPLVVGSFRPANWMNTANANVEEAFQDGFVGLSVSEPLWNNYYPQPAPELVQINGGADQDGDGNPDFPLFDAYFDFTDPATSPRDTPVDVALNSDRIPTDGDEPTLGTIPDYCSAFLQRLADPTRRYHPVFNPYRTVDWLTIDLTVFSGDDREGSVNNNPADYAQRSRQRNGFLDGNAANALFSYETNIPIDEATTVDTASPHYFALTPGGAGGAYMYNSLSFLNTASPLAGGGFTPAAGASNPDFQGFPQSIGSGGNPQVLGTDRNQPTTAFSLHPWLNRPFASHFELLMVPACSAGRLNEEFTPAVPGLPSAYPPQTQQVVQGAGGGNVIDDSAVELFRGRHRHLLNFFQMSEEENQTAQFARVFDYVTTLPRFRGEVDVVNPTRLNLMPGGSPMATGSRIFGTGLQSPFNFFHDGRRQGQINLNTLADYPVWLGLMHGHLLPPELGSGEGDAGEEIAFQKFQRSRRGYPVNGGGTPQRLVAGGSINSNATNRYNFSPEQLDGNFPTQFAGVFRQMSDADMAPQLPNIHQPAPKLGRAGVSGTLLRHDADATATWDTTLADTPFFVRETQTAAHLNVDRNPWARYQTLMRMPNLTTNQSHVFVVRLTLGFFEVDANNTASVGAEYKADIAENERYRMMYIIDRSRPVGFVPGEDLNARDVVVFERRIQ